MQNPTNASRNRISSGGTWFMKYVFPTVWFGFLGIFFVVASAQSVRRRQGFPIPFLLIPIGMALFGYFIFRQLIFDLADEVFDAGDSLIVRKGKIRDRIALSNIMNVSYTVASRPPRVTLTLRRPSLLGSEISFAAPVTLVPFAKKKEILALIERIDRARQGPGWVETS